MNSNNTFWITRLRAWATISVIMLHVSAPILLTFNREDVTAIWWICNFYNSITRFCVPAFLMITGALLFSHELTIKEFYTKRLKRVVLPFIFWSIIYVIYTLTTHYSSVNEILTITTFKFILSLLFAGSETSFHLWYVYMIIGIYLFMPIIGEWVRKSDKNSLLLFLSLWVLSIVLEYSFIKKLNIKLDLRYFSGYMGYVVLGYFLFRTDNSKRFLYLGVFLFLTGFTITFLGTYILSNKNGVFMHTLYEYLSVNVILLSTGVFILMKSDRIKSLLPAKIITSVAEHSYGVYLSHILVLNLFSQLGLNWKTFNSIISVPLIAVLCTALSMILIILLRKIPLVKQLAG